MDADGIKFEKAGQRVAWALTEGCHNVDAAHKKGIFGQATRLALIDSGLPVQWDGSHSTVTVNRTEALDASLGAVREKLVELPRRMPIVEEFAKHLAADAKILDEDEETGAKRYRYIRTGPDHYSLAFCYAWMAAHYGGGALLRWMRDQVRAMEEERQ